MRTFTTILAGACLAAGSLLGTLAAQEAAPPVATEPAAPAAPAANPEADALEAQCLEWFKSARWPKDADPQEQRDAFKKTKAEYLDSTLPKLFDLRLKDVADKAKADGYVATKATIVKNNFNSGMRARAQGWKFDFETPETVFKKK
jgi:hypothetical protein